MSTSKVLTAGEARDKMNEVGLDRASWDGFSFSLILKDGTAISINIPEGYKRGEVITLAPSLIFIHKLLRITDPIEKY